jgi:hypothetical protein
VADGTSCSIAACFKGTGQRLGKSILRALSEAEQNEAEQNYDRQRQADQFKIARRNVKDPDVAAAGELLRKPQTEPEIVAEMDRSWTITTTQRWRESLAKEISKQAMAYR